MTASAAMVQLKVVKGGGGGPGAALSCAQILALFDPEITFGAHEKMQGSLSKVEAYDPKLGKGYQAEHFPPAGTLHVSGRSGTLVSGAAGSSYSTSSGLTWMAHDGQTAGREHKILTDRMREFSQANDAAGRKATLDQWLGDYKEGVKDALKKADPKRKIKKPPDLDEDALIDQAAECIHAAAKQYFDEAGVGGGTELRNPWPATAEQHAAQAAQQADALATAGAF